MGNLRSYLKNKKLKKANKELAISFDLLIHSMEKQVSLFENEISVLQDKYRTDLIPPIFNSFIFFRTSFIDIINSLKQSLTVSGSESEKNLNSRTLALHLYEVLDDAKDFLGKNMKDGLIGLDNSDFLVKDLYYLKEIYKAVKNNSFTELADIRHNTIAHKEQNSIVLRNKIKNISVRKIETYALISTLFFMMVMHFQNSVILSLKAKMDSSSMLGRIRIKLDGGLKLRSVQAEFKKIAMILQGTHPELAEALCDLTKEEQNFLLKVIEEIKVNAK